MNLSVVLPCYNEELNIESAVRDVAQWMNSAAINGEIIVVDDGSKDGSPAILERLSKEFPNLRIVTHRKNGGYGIAIRSGCDAAATEWIAFMDSDAQFYAKDLGLLIAHADRYPFITGRRNRRADSFVRNTLGKILGAFNVIVLGLWVRDVNCGMKMFRRDIWPEIRPTAAVEKLFNTEMFLRLKQKGIPWHQVNVPHYPRTAGNPTGSSPRVIIRMFKELFDLRRSLNQRGDAVQTSALSSASPTE
jgi:glycosyltransferase involved in cell wall biosynthesis